MSNKRGLTTWVDKQAHEKAKIRCLLDDKEFINMKKNIKSGTFKDSRDQKEYGQVEIDGTIWMSENLAWQLLEQITKHLHEIMVFMLHRNLHWNLVVHWNHHSLLSF